MPRFRPALWLTLAALGAGGCGPSDPLERVVAAESPAAFAMWKSRAASSLTPEQARDLEEMIQELKLAVMAGSEATGSAAVEEAVRAKIDKHTLREALRLGFDRKVKRLTEERRALLVATEQNSRLTTRPGDAPSTVYLDQFRQKQATRLEAVERELRSAQQKLTALGTPAGTAPK